MSLYNHLSYLDSEWLRFGEESVEKMVDWTLQYVPTSEQPSILEVGSGNGTLLFAIMDAGYSAEKLFGIDYSPGSVKLSQSIASTRGGEQISFHMCDFLKDEPPPLKSMPSNGHWDLVLDKGTFDAIALMEKDENGVSPAMGYPARAARLLKPGGHFLITCTLSKSNLNSVFVKIDYVYDRISLQLYRGGTASSFHRRP